MGFSATGVTRTCLAGEALSSPTGLGGSRGVASTPCACQHDRHGQDGNRVDDKPPVAHGESRGLPLMNRTVASG